MLDSLLSEDGLPLQHSSRSRPDKQQQPDKPNSLRWLVNCLLIIFVTIEAVTIVQSQVYLHADLLRSFLTFYADRASYPQLFDGNALYLNIADIQELQANLIHTFNSISKADSHSLVQVSFQEANISLQVEYHSNLVGLKKEAIFPINPEEGILHPFNLSNLSQFQQFLLEVHYFEVVVEDLKLETEGLLERYTHRIIYHYEDGGDVEVRYDFRLSDSIASSIAIDRPQGRFLLLIKAFYLVVLLLGLLGLYLNASHISSVLKAFYIAVEENSHTCVRNKSEINKVSTGEVERELKMIEANVKVRRITLHSLGWHDYLSVLEAELILNVIANLLQVMGNVYLLFGRKHEVVVGAACLLSWITLFQHLTHYKRLIIMYELLKISLFAVMQFLVSFLLIFAGYTCLGLCLFPRVRQFHSLSRTVTTLAAMMAGDSICEITTAMSEKVSTILVVIYIFSYILMFMHAIHNTLISILKEFYLLKQVDLFLDSQQQGQPQAQKEAASLPPEKMVRRLSDQGKLQLQLFKREKQFRAFEIKTRQLLQLLQRGQMRQKWEAFDNNLHKTAQYNRQLEGRLSRMHRLTQIQS